MIFIDPLLRSILFKRFVFTGFVLAIVGSPSAAMSSDQVDYETQIKPLLEAKCLSCHGPRLRKAIFEWIASGLCCGEVIRGSLRLSR